MYFAKGTMYAVWKCTVQRIVESCILCPLLNLPTWEREYLYLHGRGSTWVREYLYRLGEGLPIHNLVFVGKSIASRVTAIAQWICLHLPCCHPWFEYHLCFYHLKSKLCYICLCIVKRTKINKKWSILKRPLQVPNISYKKWLHSKWQIPVFFMLQNNWTDFPGMNWSI